MNRLSKNEKQIQKLLNEQEFTFDEAHWAGAKELLDREMPRRRKRRALLWFVPILGLLGAGAWYFSGVKIAGMSINPQHSAERPATITNETGPGLVGNTLDEINPNDTNYAQAITGTMGAINVTGDEGENNSQSYQIQGGPPALMAAQYALNENADRQNTTPATNNPTPHTTHGSGGDSYTPTLEDIKLNIPNASLLIPGETNPVPETVTEKGESKVTPNPAPLPLKPEENKQPKPADDTEPIEKDTATPPVTENIDTAGKKTEEEKKVKETKKQVLLKNSITPVVGGNYSRIINPVATQYNPALYFGVWYNRVINQNWQLSTGLGYSKVNAEGLNKTYTAEQYSFGVHRQQTSITTNTLHYLEVPVLARFSPVKSFSIVGGINAGYLLNTGNTITGSGYASLEGANTQPAQNTTAYRHGISNWNLQWQLGLEAHFLNQRLHLGLLAADGLNDVANNGFYNNTAINRTRRLQLYLRYDVIRF